MTIQILEWVELASWQWDYDDDMCCFCQDSIDSCCADCKHPTDCPPIMGECGHIFHKHCVEMWFTQHDDCPYCRKKWKEIEFMETE